MIVESITAVFLGGPEDGERRTWRFAPPPFVLMEGSPYVLTMWEGAPDFVATYCPSKPAAEALGLPT